jgi:FO synthase
MPHHGSPDKLPERRLETIRLAGELEIPFTTGILIGIGETREERLEALEAIRGLHQRYGHIQEVIVQNFRAKPTIPMRGVPDPSLDDLVRTIAVARLILGAEMNLQAPPNLADAAYGRLPAAGLNDWGGISPLTPDHINPERPWPLIRELRRATEQAGHALRERLAIYPEYTRRPEFVDTRLRAPIARYVDTDGLVREDLERWRAW